MFVLQQTQAHDPTVNRCWTSGVDSGSTSKQCWEVYWDKTGVLGESFLSRLCHVTNMKLKNISIRTLVGECVNKSCDSVYHGHADWPYLYALSARPAFNYSQVPNKHTYWKKSNYWTTVKSPV